MTESSFAVRKNIRVNSTHYFIIKTPNKQELQQIAYNYLSDTHFKRFINLYRKFTTKLASDDSLRFRKILLEKT